MTNSPLQHPVLPQNNDDLSVFLDRFITNPFDSQTCFSLGNWYYTARQFPYARAYLLKALTCEPSPETTAAATALLESIPVTSPADKSRPVTTSIAQLQCYNQPQRILFIGDYLYPTIGGAEKSMLTILADLASDGHHCFAICSGEKPTVTVANIAITYSTQTAQIEQLLTQIKPDLILTQLNIAEHAVALAKKHHIPSLLFIRSIEYFCATPMEFDSCDKDCNHCSIHPYNRTIRQRYSTMIADADHVICNSQFMSQLTRDFYGRENTVIYPPVILAEHCAVHNTKTFITLCKPELYKGSEIFFAIARELPQYRFLTVGKGSSVQLPNLISYQQTDPLLFFGHTRLLLVPSILPEAFGRIALEAMANGIPVIASNRGGLPEIIGESGILIDDYKNSSVWSNAVATLLEDPDRYAQLSSLALERSSHFSAAAQLSALKPIINSLLELTSLSSDRRVLDFYNKQYTTIATYHFLFEQRREHLEGLCNMVQPDEWFLDVGCADGAHLEVLHKRGNQGLGIDISVPNILRGLSTFPHLRFVHGFAESLPFVNSLVDVVIMGDILEHLRNPAAAITEALRVASRGVAICVRIGEKTREHIHPFPSIRTIKELFTDLPVRITWYSPDGSPQPEAAVTIAAEKPWVYLRIDKTVTPAIIDTDSAKRQQQQTEPEHVRDEWQKRSITRNPQEVIRFAATAAIIRGPVVLEMACGNGDLSMAMVRSGKQLFGIDIMPRAIAWAKRTAKAQGVSDRATFAVNDAAATEFPDNHFDAVIIPEMIEHLKDPHLIILEALRVVKVGGQILISVPDGQDPNPDHIRTFTAATLAVELAQYTTAVTWHRLPFKRWLIGSFMKQSTMLQSPKQACNALFSLQQTVHNVPLEQKPLVGFNLVGAFGAGSGWGAALRGLISALIEAGYPVSLHEVPLPGQVTSNNPYRSVVDAKGYEMPYAFTFFCLPPAQLDQLFATAPHWLRLKNRLNIALPLATGFEAELQLRFTFGKVDALATFDERIDSFLQRVLPSTPRFSLPHAAYPYECSTLNRVNFGLPHEKLLIGSFVTAGVDPSLQHTDTIIQAFHTYNTNQKACLIIIIDGTMGKDTPAVAQMRRMVNNSPAILLFEGMLGSSETGALLACCDLFCTFYAAGGTPALLTEAMRLTSTVITSTNALPTYPDLTTAVCTVACVTTNGIAGKPDFDQLVACLRECAENTDRRGVIGKLATTVVEQYQQSLYQGVIGDLATQCTQALTVKMQRFTAVPCANNGQFSRLRVLFQNRPDMFDRPGGDTAVLYALKKELEAKGVYIEISTNPTHSGEGFDIVHTFNTTLAEYSDAFTRNALANGKLLVATSLQEDFPRYMTRARIFYEIFSRYIKHGQPQQLFDKLTTEVDLNREGPLLTAPLTISHAAALYTSGEEESSCINRHFSGARTVVARFGLTIPEEPVDGSIFSETFGITDFVLCVGRLESRKNQLMLLKALENETIPLVFITGGVLYQPAYAELCHAFKRQAPTLFLDRLDRKMLLSAYAASRVHALPSWYELPGLVTLEAAALGCRIVASSWGTTRDYVGDAITYCEPDSVASIRQAIFTAIDTPPDPTLVQTMRAFTWESSAATIFDSYQNVAASGNNTNPDERPAPQLPSQPSAATTAALEEITKLIENGQLNDAIVLYEKVRTTVESNPDLRKFGTIMQQIRAKVSSS